MIALKQRTFLKKISGCRVGDRFSCKPAGKINKSFKRNIKSEIKSKIIILKRKATNCKDEKVRAAERDAEDYMKEEKGKDG